MMCLMCLDLAQGRRGENRQQWKLVAGVSCFGLHAACAILLVEVEAVFQHSRHTKDSIRPQPTTNNHTFPPFSLPFSLLLQIRKYAPDDLKFVIEDITDGDDDKVCEVVVTGIRN